MVFLSSRIDFFNIDTWNKLKKNWNKAFYSNFLDIIIKLAENLDPTESCGDECTITRLLRYPSMERM